MGGIGLQAQQLAGKGTKKDTAKIHISPEIANLLKIYCVLNDKKMVEYATEVFSKELKDFKVKLDALKRVNVN